MKSALNLTRRQLGIVNCIRTSVSEHGYPPSIREIGLAVGLTSSSTVHTHLKNLEEKGVLKRNPSKPRSLELLEPRINSSPLAIQHKRIVDKVRELREDLAGVAAAPPIVHDHNTHEEASIAKIKAGAMVEAYQKVLDYLMDTSPLGGLQ